MEGCKCRKFRKIRNGYKKEDENLNLLYRMSFLSKFKYIEITQFLLRTLKPDITVHAHHPHTMRGDTTPVDLSHAAQLQVMSLSSNHGPLGYGELSGASAMQHGHSCLPPSASQCYPQVQWEILNSFSCLFHLWIKLFLHFSG